MSDFKIDLSQLKTRSKYDSAPDMSRSAVERIDAAAERHGFIEREPKKKRGRKPSPRTGQVHAKVLPHVSVQISNEAKRRGVQQGVVLEEAWELYVDYKLGGNVD